MREFEFRVWDCLSKRMLSWGDISHLPAWEIFPGTPEQRAFNVMQYIGLKDSTGKEIYEGDVVEYTLFDNLTLYKVNYNDKTFSWQLSNKLENVNIEYAFKTRLRVVGNIYENPDIWEGNYD